MEAKQQGAQGGDEEDVDKVGRQVAGPRAGGHGGPLRRLATPTRLASSYTTGLLAVLVLVLVVGLETGVVVWGSPSVPGRS